jgi:hypothetical protein
MPRANDYNLDADEEVELGSPSANNAAMASLCLLPASLRLILSVGVMVPSSTVNGSIVTWMRLIVSKLDYGFG